MKASARFPMFLAVAVGLFAIYYISSPHLVLRATHADIEEGNGEAVCERVNFPEVRANVTDRIDEDSPAAFLQTRAIESALTCDSVVGGVDMYHEWSKRQSEDSEGVDDIDLSFEGLFTFSVHFDVPRSDAKIKLVWSRTLTSWEVTNIEFVGGEGPGGSLGLGL